MPPPRSLSYRRTPGGGGGGVQVKVEGRGGAIFINLLNTFHVQILGVNFKHRA